MVFLLQSADQDCWLEKRTCFLEKLSSLDIRVALAETDQSPILDLARQEILTVYDASYLALSMSTGLPLATLDAALAKAARKRGVEVLASNPY